jgi:positive regulator of sigma E activity
MLYQSGLITRIHDGRAVVECEAGTSCHACLAGHGCGLGPLLTMFRRRDSRFSVEVDIGPGQSAEVGDRVRVGLPANEIIKMSSIAYLFPLIGMLTGAWMSATLLPQFGDISGVAGALAGLFSGWAAMAATRNPAPVILVP